MSAWLAAGALGLASAPHCMGMCGPLASLFATEKGPSIGYHAARVATYTALGAAAGSLGDRLRSAMPHGVATTLFALAAAAALLVVAIRLLRTPSSAPLVPASSLVRKVSRRRWLAPALGVATGLLPCGALYAALTIAATTTAREGALATCVFALVSGTGLLLTQRAVRLLAADPRGRTIVACVLVVGAVLTGARGLADVERGSSCHDASSSAAEDGR